MFGLSDIRHKKYNWEEKFTKTDEYPTPMLWVKRRKQIKNKIKYEQKEEPLILK